MQQHKMQENFIVQVMNNGLTRAASSFSRFIGQQVTVSNSKPLFNRPDDGFNCILEEKGQLYVLVTQIIGDLFGKSYLIFTEEESKCVLKTMELQQLTSSEKFKEGVLMEVDNIISASVIAELSNELNVEIYGDVPALKKMEAAELKGFILADIAKEGSSDLLCMNTTFQFSQNLQVHPQFIWKLSSKVYERIPQERLTIR